MMTAKRLNRIKKSASRFGSLANAEDFRNRAVKTMMIVLGDDSLFWVVSFRDAAELEGAGYEVL